MAVHDHHRGGERHGWTWPQLRALPAEHPTVDIHCVTGWSKLATSWTGVSLDVLLDGVETAADFALVHAAGGYTTGVLARARMFDAGPGIVLRCPGCDGVLLRMARTPGRAVLDLRGLAHLEVPFGS